MRLNTHAGLACGVGSGSGHINHVAGWTLGGLKSRRDLLGEIGDIWPVNISKVMGRQMVVLELDGTDHDQFARREVTTSVGL
uniref:Uncharacterized protein n=1 Tax=Oryza meridionalis TaxID=40149 RepID=A0A0E0F8X4_9ORYZ